MLYRIGFVICKFYLRTFFRIRIWGRENLPVDSRFITASNHINFWDPPFIGTSMGLKFKVHFMAKKELFGIPVFGAVIRGWGAFPVHRGGADLKALGEAIKLVRNGKTVCLFPEGTRSKTDSLLKGRPGAALIALETDAPILPTAVYIKRRRFCRPEYRLKFGKAFSLSGLFSETVYPDHKQRVKAATEYLMQVIAGLHRELKAY
ncbi:MAG: lysophospholipid acyltransferase family protein [Bacillota bacterium]